MLLDQMESQQQVAKFNADIFCRLLRNVAFRGSLEDRSAAVDRLFTGCDVEARPYQRRIVDTAVKMYAGLWPGMDGRILPAAQSVLVESPTGSGKTVMGLAIASIMQETTGCRVGWVAMRRNLLSQATEENTRRGFDVQMSPISMFEKHPPKVDLLIVDEAQHDAATSMANLHSSIQPRWTLGLSATPFRTDRIKLCFDQVIRDAGIAQLIADGYLSPYHHFTISKYTPRAVADLLISDPQRWGQSLVFFHRRDQCEALAKMLFEAKISCEVVTATSNRERQLGDFEEGRTQVLINMAILTEGFDCPRLQTVFVRPSGKGCTIQMAGRVLRTAASMPFKNIVQCRETRHPMLKTAMAAEQYIWTADGWRSIKANRKLDEIARSSRAIVAKTSVSLPKLVTANRRRGRRFRRSQPGI